MSEQKRELSNGAVIALLVIGWIAFGAFLQAMGYVPNANRAPYKEPWTPSSGPCEGMIARECRLN
jgi:hypothetical protein